MPFWDGMLLHKILLAVGDMASMAAAFYLSFSVRNHFFAWRGGVYDANIRHFFLLLGLCSVLFVFFRNSSLYRQPGFSRSIHHLEALLRSWVTLVAIFLGIAFFLRIQLFIEHRITVGLFALLGIAFLYVSRFLVVPALMRSLSRRVDESLPTLLIGTGPEGRQQALTLNRAHGQYHIVGYLDDRPADPPLPYPHLGTPAEVAAVVLRERVREVFVDRPGATASELTTILGALEPLPVRVRVALHHFGVLRNKVDYLPDVQEGIVFINHSPLLFFDRALKRAVDLAGALAAVLLAAPLMIAAAVAIKLESLGPVLFRQSRTGKNGKPFDVLKFRSMSQNTEAHHREAVAALMQGRTEFFAEPGGAPPTVLKAVDASKVTRVGSFLRRTSIDELPQLFNVLRGEMSLVGPRPEPEYQVALYQPWQHQRHRVKPGITGFWQVYGRSSVTHEDMVLMDIFYINNWSISLDLRILARTLLVVLTNKGAV